ncbi:hypothetical protein Poli38472_010336 [Pythium oligandrum]|uniref:Uncharacterized protein n=1 Tax=Pythium oligandrum TaxID=41045 RepID=A0A8K1FC41_PYTOL|nr:hypothetical protein Poli38472_010336 [Pythium oligandrum]|eukprot:TMW55454.1 hypothetical protein Poli38472_010336 [Pythium oligandrum]
MYRTLVSSSKSSFLALLMMLVFVVFVFLHAVDVLPEHYATIKINDFEVDTVEVFVNVSSTLSVLVSCIVYRRRRVLKDTSLKLITCALLRTRLTLVPASRTASGTTSTHMQMKLRRESVLGSRNQSATQSARLRQHRAKLARAVLAAYRLKAPAISFSARSKLLEAASDHSSLHRQLLRIVPQALQNIDSRDTLVRHVTPSKDLSRLEKRALYLVGVIGMSLTVASFVPLDVSGTKQIVLQVGAFVTSVAFVVVFVACMQRQLLRSIAYRFDLLFSAFQFIAASLFLATMLQWDTRCFVVMASMMWFAWILLSMHSHHAMQRTCAFFEVMRKHYAKFIVLFRIGTFFLLAALVAKAELGRVFAIVTCVLGSGSLISSTLMISSQLSRLLWSSPEVIFMSTINTISWAILASLYRDGRSVVCLLPWWAIQLSICSDALYRTVVSLSKSAVTAVLMVVVLTVFVFMQEIDVPPDRYASIKINNVELDIIEVFVNVSSTLCILVGCIIYRRRRVFKDASLKLITCALLRSRLKLVPVSRTESSTVSVYTRHRRESALATRTRSASHSAKLGQRQAKLARAVLAAYRLKAPAISFSARSKLLAAALDRRLPHRQQLRIVPQAFQNIDSRNTLIRRLTPIKDLSRGPRQGLYLTGFIGLALTVVSFMLMDERDLVSQPVEITLHIGAFLTSTFFLTVFVASMQRQLLRSLAHRFDLLFSAVQSVTASLFIAEMLRWDVRCLAVLTSTMWFVAILHTDALTPRVRRHFGFKKRYAGWALVILSLCKLRVTASLVFDMRNGYHDSEIARFSFGHSLVVYFRTKSAFLNRMFPLTVWTLRMLWELLMRRDEELVFIRGTLEYFCPMEMLPAIHSSQVHPKDDGIGPSQGRAPAISFTVRSTLLQATYDRTTPHLQQLRIVPSALFSIDGRNTLIPGLTPTKDLSRQNLVFLYLNGIMGLLLTIISFLVLDSRESVSWTVQVSLQVGAYLTSIVFLGTFTAAMEKQLLRSLSMQFDLLFNVVQFILAAACMADMLQFDARCLAVHTMTLWFFWILHVDALTPRVRKHLGFKKRCTGWALIAILACLARVVVSLVFDTQNHYDDSMIASIAVIHGVTVQLRTKSVFLNRIFPLTVWTLRMLWELLYRREDELVFIRGTIEYYCPLEMLPVSHNSHTKHAAVVPSAESIQSRGPSTDRPEV